MDRIAALEHERESLAGLDGELDPEGRADLRGPVGAGRVDHDAAGDVASFGKGHAGDPCAFAAHRERLVLHKFDTERSRLAPVRLKQRVRVDVSLVAVAQEPTRDAAGIEPGIARPQLVRGSEVHIGPKLALQNVVLEHHRQHRFGGEQQVAVLAKTHVGRLAVDREVFVEVLEEVDPEQADPDVLGG